MDETKPNPHRPPPGLYFVATPIGAARDITLRALDILATADVLAAEDTRTLRHLMEIHGIAMNGRPVLAYHDHNAPQIVPRLLADLRAGKVVAYASDAGTPLVSDPGFQLGRAAIAEGLPVHTAPGPSAVLAALTLSGLPSDRFLFAGFPPDKQGARRSFLQDMGKIPATLILFESPKRVARLLTEMCDEWGQNRNVVVCRELTKRFEEVTRGPVGDLAAAFADREVKGEIVVLVDRMDAADAVVDLDGALDRALATLSVKDAVAQVTAETGLPRGQVYKAALAKGRGE
jgi:16S rRNA (cytidine1402-2'-O)-methyltransferase